VEVLGGFWNLAGVWVWISVQDIEAKAEAENPS